MGCFLLKNPLAEAIGLPNEFEDTCSVSESIQQGSRHFFVSKDLIPFGKAQIGGDNDGDAFIQLATQLKQELTALFRKRDTSQFVEHHQVEFTDLSHEFGEAKVFLSREEIIHQIACAEEADAFSKATRSNRKPGRQVCLPQSWIPDQNDRLFLCC